MFLNKKFNLSMKISFLLTTWFLVIVVHADQSSWNSFQTRNHKVYTNQAELELRQKIFNENLQGIEKHNKKYEQGLVSYKLGINKFSDLTDEEFAALSKTVKADTKTLQGGLENPYFANNDTKIIPDEIDWRTKAVVSEVKDQGVCGSCWAFSATGTLESQVAIQTGALKSFSEQQLVDCDVASNKGCSGGIVQYAYDYIKDNGLTLEANYPYKGVDKACRSSKRNSVVWTRGYVNIDQNNETDLRQAVGLIGPVSVAINSIPIRSYQEGIFDGECSNALDHAVLAVGYGKDTVTGVEYWIIKNSWGPAWGDQGYFKLKMWSNLCGVAQQACYPLLGNSGFSLQSGIISFLILGLYLFLH